MTCRMGILILSLSVMSCKTDAPQPEGASASKPTAPSVSAQASSEAPAQAKPPSAEALAGSLQLAANTLANSPTCKNPTPQYISMCAHAKTVGAQSTTTIQNNIINTSPSNMSSAEALAKKKLQMQDLQLAGAALIIIGNLVFLESFITNVRNTVASAEQKWTENVKLSSEQKKVWENYKLDLNRPLEPKEREILTPELAERLPKLEERTSNARSLEANITMFGIGAALNIIGGGMIAGAKASGLTLADTGDADVAAYLNAAGEIFGQMKTLKNF